jgi:Zn finger protein HypA/HybF involved in hydrogenase expression
MIQTFLKDNKRITIKYFCQNDGEIFACESCDWEGTFESTEQEVSSQEIQSYCPRCKKILAQISYRHDGEDVPLAALKDSRDRLAKIA